MTENTVLMSSWTSKRWSWWQQPPYSLAPPARCFCLKNGLWDMWVYLWVLVCDILNKLHHSYTQDCMLLADLHANISRRPNQQYCVPRARGSDHCPVSCPCLLWECFLSPACSSSVEPKDRKDHERNSAFPLYTELCCHLWMPYEYTSAVTQSMSCRDLLSASKRILHFFYGFFMSVCY